MNLNMKKITFLVILVLTTLVNVAQNLTMAQLLELKKKNLGEAEEFLTLKGWEFLNASEPTEEKMGVATFTFNKDYMSDRAQSFLRYMYSANSNTIRLTIQVFKKEKYNEYTNAIKGYGCKMIDSKIEDGNLIKVYRGKTTTIEITSTTTENAYGEASVSWVFLIADNFDYDLLQLSNE